MPLIRLSKALYFYTSCRRGRSKADYVLSNYLQSPYYFMCCNLSDLNQDPRSPIGNPQLSNSQQQVLAGTLVSSLHRLKDIDNTGGSSSLFENAFFWSGDVEL